MSLLETSLDSEAQRNAEAREHRDRGCFNNYNLNLELQAAEPNNHRDTNLGRHSPRNVTDPSFSDFASFPSTTNLVYNTNNNESADDVDIIHTDY